MSLTYECGSCEYQGTAPVKTEPHKGFEIFYHCEKCGYEVIPS